MSLANVVAISGAAKSLVLLGDPNQLPQVSQGTHPDGAGVSALEHVLAGAPDDPARPGPLPRDHLAAPPRRVRLRLGGLLRGPVEAGGPEREATDRRDAAAGRLRPEVRPGGPPANAARSSEEARQWPGRWKPCSDETWTNDKGETRPLKLEDILVVAPYNAQVGEISRLLRDQFGEGERVGTVDKFQGQEGAVVLYSMATSSPEDAPRGMDFLYSGNRFNVAVSRARGLAVLLCSPDLLKVRCRTPEEMRLANALCRFVELSGPVDWAVLAEGSPEDEREPTHA